MADFYLKSGVADFRANSTVYAVGQKVALPRGDTQANHGLMKRYIYECTATTGTGTSGAAVPAWVYTPGSTTTDGEVTWTCRECDSWLNASPYMDFIASRLVAGDRLFVSHQHAEDTGLATVSLTFAGTLALPNTVLCVDEATGALATTASVTAPGGSTFTCNGSVYVYGVSVNIGSTAASVSINFAANAAATVQEWERCVFSLASTGTSQQAIAAGSTGSAAAAGKLVRWTKCDVKFTSAGHVIGAGSANLVWNGGKIVAGSTTPNFVFLTGRGSGQQGDITVSGIDFSALSASVTLFGAAGQGRGLIRNSRLPALWTGALAQSLTHAMARYEAHNCDSIDTNYRLEIADYAGSVKTQTGTLIRSGGATDGVVPYSWKLATSATASFLAPLAAPELARWNATVGAPVTVTVDVLHDSATVLTNGEIWLDVQYLGTSGLPLSMFASNAMADVLAAAVAQPASSATWDTTGMANPNRQKLSVTFTPQEAGFLQAKVVLSKPNATVYVDPKLQVT